jgi:hypothetical protein
MNRKEIIEKLKQYSFDKSKYIVIAGAAMVLLGIKDKTSDIDIATTQDYNDYLVDNYNVTFEKINEYNEPVYFIDNIVNFSVTYYSDKKEYVEDIPVQNVNDILRLKKRLNREKDKIDIEKLEEYKRLNL